MLKSTFVLAAIVALANCAIVLERQDYLRLPNRAGNYVINSNTAKETAFDDVRHFLYVIGKDTAMLYVIDVSNPTNTFIRHTHLFDVNSDGRPLDVELCRAGTANILAISFDSQVSSTSDGHVTLYRLFEGSQDEVLVPQNPGDPFIPVGPHPDNIKFTSDCLRLIVANEGEPRVENGVFIDPSGSVSKLDLNLNDLTAPPGITEITFTSYNSGANFDDIMAKGVRFWLRRDPISGGFHTFSQTAEPEYIAISPNNGHAYVTLQENNAIVKLSLELNTIESFVALGNKSFSAITVDANDQDNIRRVYRQVTSLYQPDKITFLEWNGNNYLLTADKGKPTSIPSASFTDYGRASSLGNWDVDAGLESELNSNAELGRAYMSSVDGLSGTLRQSAVMFGGRGFSVMNAETYERIWESGDELERYSAEYFNTTFNGDCCIQSQTPVQQADARSTWMGPEISALAIGNYGTQTVIVLGSGRNGLLYVYRLLPTSTSPTPEFQSVYRGGTITGTWANLYATENMGDAIISDIKFTNDPNPLFMVTSMASGSVSFYSLNEQTTHKNSN